LAAIQVASEQELKVPADLSIVGMDDIESAAMSTPLLTTIAKDKYEIGQQAARLLLRRLQGTLPEAPEQAIVPCRLVERQSAAPFGQ
jgi:LacI family transcriptional regulator